MGHDLGKRGLKAAQHDALSQATNFSFSGVVLETIGSPGCPGYFGIGIAAAGCRDVRFTDVRGTAVQDAGNLDDCENLAMEDVHIQCSQPPPKGVMVGSSRKDASSGCPLGEGRSLGPSARSSFLCVSCPLSCCLSGTGGGVHSRHSAAAIRQKMHESHTASRLLPTAAM